MAVTLHRPAFWQPPIEMLLQLIEYDEPEWANAILHRSTFQLPSGRFAIEEDPRDQPFPRTVAQCGQLAREAAASFEGGLLLDSDGAEDTLYALYVAVNPSFSAPAIDEDTIRAVFGPDLYPDADIKIETMAEDAACWQELMVFEEGDPETSSGSPPIET